MKAFTAKRVQFEFTPQQVERLRVLRERMEFSSNAMVVAYALRVLEFLTDPARKKFALCEDGKLHEILPL